MRRPAWLPVLILTLAFDHGIAYGQGATSVAAPAMALSPQPPEGAGGDPQTAVAQPETSSKPSANVTTSIQGLLGPYADPGGIRSFLAKRGIEYSLTYVGEVLGNLSGGFRRGAIYEGRLDLQVDANLEQLAGWKGATFHTNFYQIHGTGLSRYYIGNLDVISGIEALPSSRLYELWIEQKLFDDQLGIKIGQIAADTEFIVSQTATLFVNSTYGFPDITGVNLPSGGPAYPLATPAVRAKYTPNKNFSLQVGLFNGDPAGPFKPGLDPDPQRRNRTGTNFRVSDPPLLIAEAAYAYNLDSEHRGRPVIDEPGTITLGGWYHFGRFGSLRFDQTGRSLADPSTTGIARRFRGNDGIYGIIDQTLFREPDKKDEGASAFIRVSGSPGDRNLVDFYVDTGIAYKGLLPGRSDDTVGISLAYSRISQSIRGLDLDTILATGAPRPVRNFEAQLEVTYQALIAPGITVQPDFQYLFHPGGNAVNPRSPTGQRIKNAAILGLRSTIRY